MLAWLPGRTAWAPRRRWAYRCRPSWSLFESTGWLKESLEARESQKKRSRCGTSYYKKNPDPEPFRVFGVETGQDGTIWETLSSR